MPFKATDHPSKARRVEIVEGILREGQVCTMAGAMNAGKSPLLKDLAIAVAAGIPWCGLKTTQRPVLMIDMESDNGQFYENLVAIAQRRGLGDRNLPIELYIKNGDIDDPVTQAVQHLETLNIEKKVAWLHEKLTAFPNALVTVDPITMLFPIDKNKSGPVNALFKAFRDVQLHYRSATFQFVYNLRKRDPKVQVPSLIDNPHGWLQEISGSLDLQNRSDVRLGLEFMIQGEREPLILNGLRRGETMEPIILESEWIGADNEAKGAGFRRVDPKTLDKGVVLGERMHQLWCELPEQFTSADINAICSRATGFRLRTRAIALGFLRETALGMFQKIG